MTETIIATLCAVLLLVVPVLIYIAQPNAEREQRSRTLRGAGQGVAIVLAIIAVGALLAIGAKLIL